MENPAVPKIPGSSNKKSFCLPEPAFDRHCTVMIVVKLRNNRPLNGIMDDCHDPDLCRHSVLIQSHACFDAPAVVSVFRDCLFKKQARTGCGVKSLEPRGFTVGNGEGIVLWNVAIHNGLQCDVLHFAMRGLPDPEQFAFSPERCLVDSKNVCCFLKGGCLSQYSADVLFFDGFQ